MKRRQDFQSWCEQNNRFELLSEWDGEVNSNINHYLSRMDRMPYDAPVPVHWKCRNGHQWLGAVAARTLFNLRCPYCFPSDTLLPIGAKRGCLTIIGISEEKDGEASKEYRRIYGPCYLCRCKCGQESEWSEFHFLEKQHKFCGDDCGAKMEQRERHLQKLERKNDQYYNLILPYSIHESLEVLGFGEDDVVLSSYLHNNSRKEFYSVKRTYRCKCQLCGEEYLFHYPDFEIKKDEYGYRATDGYYSDAKCKCHIISSFQWRTIDILRKHGVEYRVEVSFPDLYGVGGKNLLRFDFGIYDQAGNLIKLLECQGEQHYLPSEEFGGDWQFSVQTQNDQRKREYAKKHGIKLVEIPYTCNTYEKETAFLISTGVIEA